MLGYIAYFFIVAFGPIQLYLMIRGRNVDLGILPLASLTLGLALLQISIRIDGAPAYIVYGNFFALVCNAIGLLWTVRQDYEQRIYERRLRDMSNRSLEHFDLTDKGRAAAEAYRRDQVGSKHA